MPPVRIHGTRIHLEQTGRGSPLVLLHGLGDTSDTWLPIIPALESTFTLIRCDLPGHGLSGGEAPTNLELLAALVAGLDALLAHLDLPSAHLAAHDLGGVVVQRLAYERPARVRSLILEGTLPAPLGSPAAALESSGHADVPGGLSVEATRSGSAVVEAASVEEGIPRLASIGCPTLVLVGEEDSWPFQHGAELLHGWIPNSRLVRIPDAGHTPHLEQPEAFAAYLRAFLEEHDR